MYKLKQLELLKTLCAIHSPSGNEDNIHSFLLNYINENSKTWKVRPEIFSGDDFQNCIVLVFGKPRTAVYAHIDNIGFTVRYGNQIVKVGGPKTEDGYLLTGKDDEGEIECTLRKSEEGELTYQYYREIERGTDLSFKHKWREDEESVQCCYMDNRLGVWNALQLCETITDGAIVFSCWEEHGGGSVAFLAKFLWDNYQIRKALISDITWITEGVRPGKGVVISMRDSGIPRQKFVREIIELAKKSNIPFQLEVENAGGSDGTEIQKQPYPIDWCFIGAAEENVHSPDEKVNKVDIESMVKMYKYLIETL